MESTAQYWRPVWVALESSFRLHLAQAQSNRAPKGRKTDSRDTERLVRRLIADELILSFIPDAAQREIRMLARRRVQLVQDRVRLEAQLECLLEDCNLKLSSVITDLFGTSGRRILEAIGKGEKDAAALAALGDRRLKCTVAQLADTLHAQLTAHQRALIRMCLEEPKLIDTQIETVTSLIAGTLQAQQDAIQRLCQVPGIRLVAAQQIMDPAPKCFPAAGI
jgi:transposase